MERFFYIATVFLRYTPLCIKKVITFVGSYILFLFDRDKKRAISENLQYILDTPNNKKIKREIFFTFYFLLRRMIAFLERPNISSEKFLQMCDIEGKKYLEEQRGRGIVFVTLHIGISDIAGVVLSSSGLHPVALQEPLRKKAFDTYKRYRSCGGVEVLSTELSAFRLIRLLKSKKALLLLGDRDITGGGVETKFLKGKRKIPDGPAFLAFRTKVPVILGFAVIRKTWKGKIFKVIIEPPIFPENFKNERELLKEIKSRIEDIISLYPEQWFVFQPNWL